MILFTLMKLIYFGLILHFYKESNKWTVHTLFQCKKMAGSEVMLFCEQSPHRVGRWQSGVKC